MSKSSDDRGSGDLFDMAKDGTTVPEDAAKPRIIPSKPRPDQIVSEPNPNSLGATNLAEAADNAQDIPRSTQDRATHHQVLTGTGDALPSETDSKRLHNVPGGVVSDPAAKGSTRYEKHVKQGGADVEYGAGEGPGVEKVPGVDDAEAMDKVDRKVV